MQVGIANPRWRGKRSRHFRRMCDLQLYVFDKRPIPWVLIWEQVDWGHDYYRYVDVLYCGPLLEAIQIKICAEYRDMLPRPRLVFQVPGLRPIGHSPGVSGKSSRGLGSMSRYSAQIWICFITYSFQFVLFLSGFVWELCRTASMHSALCHCLL